jgi:hypothetical protein
LEIYSAKDGTGRKFSVYKEQVGPGVAVYFIEVSTPCGAQRCALSANSALNLGRALLWSAHADGLQPAPEKPRPRPPTLHAVD